VPGATITVTIQDEQVRLFIEELAARFSDLTPLMRNIGQFFDE